MEKILANGRVPFIVGGTNYYIESLLWKVLMDDRDTDSDSEYDSDSKSERARIGLCSDMGDLELLHPLLQCIKNQNGRLSDSELLEKWSSNQIHEALKEVDPERALKVHPNDTRKMLRSLQIFFRTGKRHSELIKEQYSLSAAGEKEESTEEGISGTLGVKLGGPLRFPNAICFWIQADRDILNRRIEERADLMLERGLKRELDAYVDHARIQNWYF